jgi:hypothetical protein
MNNPKEKAQELFNKYANEIDFDDTYRGYKKQSKQCALIAVDEILELLKILEINNSYYLEVKQEIEKL